MSNYKRVVVPIDPVHGVVHAPLFTALMFERLHIRAERKMKVKRNDTETKNKS